MLHDPRQPDSDQAKPTFTPFPEQNADGVDLSLIRANLRLTPTERVRRNDQQRRAMLRLRQHARRITPEHA